MDIKPSMCFSATFSTVIVILAFTIYKIKFVRANAV